MFEFRVCQNPDCGLRYPAQRGDRSAVRCPLCLGRTEVLAERSPDEMVQSRPQAELLATAPCALLDNIRSVLNVGSMFRTAEGFGFAHLYLCGITPTPESPRMAKTALRAEAAVPWSLHKNAVQLARSLKDGGTQLWALERTPYSQPLELVLQKEGSVVSTPRLVIVGNERAGVDPGLLELADHTVHLEMYGEKESFNVAAAFAIAAYVLSKASARAAPAP